MADLRDIEMPLLDAIDLCEALKMMSNDREQLEDHCAASIRTVASKALESLYEIKRIWKESLRLDRDDQSENASGERQRAVAAFHSGRRQVRLTTRRRANAGVARCTACPIHRFG